MEGGRCNVVYFDGLAHDDFTIDHTNITGVDAICAAQARGAQTNPARSSEELTANVRALSIYFGTVHVCATSKSCLEKVMQLDQSNFEDIPTVVLIAVPSEDESQSNIPNREAARSPSPMSSPQPQQEPDRKESKTLSLLRELANRMETENSSAAIVPVVVLHVAAFQILREVSGVSNDMRGRLERRYANNMRPTHPEEYIDAGAFDILPGPLSRDRAHGLRTLAYRTQKDFAKRGLLLAKPQRRTSWVGVAEEKPYAYLREAMVSRLMDSICDPNQAAMPVEAIDVKIDESQHGRIAASIGSWTFSAHDYSDDELLFGALLILEHTLASPELEKWRMRRDRLAAFLTATRRVYNSFVLYHNFRHACDVLQATFVFLIQIGSIPSFPHNAGGTRKVQSSLAALVRPFDALTLLISAIGHDVGHPGVNNLFLITLNAPLAQLYNDRSVLESFHCAAYSQILRRYWPAAFADSTMRKLMINTILATDMGLHAQYMLQLAKLSEFMAANGNSLDGTVPKVTEEYRELVCCLLIKCADICNVARQFTVATKWAYILTEEFQNQSMMEEELQMPTCLFGGPPVRDDIIKMGGSQLGFMNFFAVPLFASVSKILPGMAFTIDVLESNRAIWEQKMEEEKQKRSSAVPPSHTPLSSTASLPVVPTQDASPAVLAREDRTSEPIAAVVAQAQAHVRKSTSNPSSRKSSGGTAAHFSGLPVGPDQSRRSSLGNAGAANAQDAGSRRSSGGYHHMLQQPQLLHSSFVTSNQLLRQLDGTQPSDGSPNERIDTVTMSEPVAANPTLKAITPVYPPTTATASNTNTLSAPLLQAGSQASTRSGEDTRSSTTTGTGVGAGASVSTIEPQQVTSTSAAPGTSRGAGSPPRSRKSMDARGPKHGWATEVSPAGADERAARSRSRSKLAALKFWKKAARGGSAGDAGA